MFGMSFPEIIVICIVGIVILGPERLPKVTYKIGKWVAQFRGAVDTFKDEVNSELTAQGIDKDIKQIKNATGELKDSIDSVTMRKNILSNTSNNNKIIFDEQKQITSSDHPKNDDEHTKKLKIPAENASMAEKKAAGEAFYKEQAKRLGWLFKDQNPLRHITLPTPNVYIENYITRTSISLPNKTHSLQSCIIPQKSNNPPYIIRHLPSPTAPLIQYINRVKLPILESTSE